MPLAITPTFSPWTHTSDYSYIYQLSLVLATATVSFRLLFNIAALFFVVLQRGQLILYSLYRCTLHNYWCSTRQMPSFRCTSREDRRLLMHVSISYSCTMMLINNMVHFEYVEYIFFDFVPAVCSECSFIGKLHTEECWTDGRCSCA